MPLKRHQRDRYKSMMLNIVTGLLYLPAVPIWEILEMGCSLLVSNILFTVTFLARGSSLTSLYCLRLNSRWTFYRGQRLKPFLIIRRDTAYAIGLYMLTGRFIRNAATSGHVSARMRVGMGPERQLILRCELCDLDHGMVVWLEKLISTGVFPDNCL